MRVCRKIRLREKRVISGLNMKLNLHVLQLSWSKISRCWVTNGFFLCFLLLHFKIKRFPYRNERFLSKHEGESITWWSHVYCAIYVMFFMKYPSSISSKKNHRLKDKIKALKYQKTLNQFHCTKHTTIKLNYFP